MNLRMITKNHADVEKLGFSQNRCQSRLAAQRPCRYRDS